MNFPSEIMQNYMTLQDFQELLVYINECHSFSRGGGKRIKYVTPIYDTRTGRIFCIKLRVSGEDKSFSVTNENKHRHLKTWVIDWLDNGTWD